MNRFDRDHDENVRRVTAGEIHAEDIEYEVRPGNGCFKHPLMDEESCPDCRSRRREREQTKRAERAHDELTRAQKTYDRKQAAARRAPASSPSRSSSSRTSGGASSGDEMSYLGLLVLVLIGVTVAALIGPVRSLGELLADLRFALLVGTPLLLVGTIFADARAKSKLPPETARVWHRAMIVTRAVLVWLFVAAWIVGDREHPGVVRSIFSIVGATAVASYGVNLGRHIRRKSGG